ncbi:MAG: hypothetical protein M1840_009018 [Geoglossum simile]|nr:MAG: hypothetical protein M1840_009018 [Geoglossum simile]
MDVTMDRRPRMAPRQFLNSTGTATGGVIATITQAPNFDFSFLPSKLARWILDNHYYSIDWEHVRVANNSILFNGAPPPQTTWSVNGSCMTWWDLPTGLSEALNDTDGDAIWETIVINAPKPLFCTSTLASFALARLRRNALLDWLAARDLSLQVRTATGGSAVTKTTVSYLPQDQKPIYHETSKVHADPDPLPTIDYGDPKPKEPSPGATPINPEPAPSSPPNPQPQNKGSADQAVDTAIANAIANLFPDSNQPPTPQNNPAPPSTAGIGAIIAAAFGNTPSGNQGNSAPLPQQGQINGVPYTVGSNGIVIGGSTYSPSNPTVVALPDGHTASIGPGGLSIDNNPVIPIPNSPSQGKSGIIDGVPYSVTPGGIVISGVTYPTTVPTSVTLPNGQTLVIGASGLVQIGGVTVPMVVGSSAWSGTVNGISYTINPDGTVIINGQTLNIATPTSIAMPDGKIVTIGPNGISFGGTIIPFPPDLLAALPTAMTISGITFSVGPGSVVIGGKTYSFPPGATGTTLVIDGKTISIGPNGVGFPSTTVPLTHNPTSTGATTKQTSSTSTASKTSTTTTKSSGTSTAPSPAKTTSKKGNAVGFKELLGSVIALELLAIFAVSLL